MTLLDSVVMQGLSRHTALTAEDKTLLLSLELNPRRVSAGEVLWQESADVDLFCVIKEGWAYSYRNLGNGSMQILKVYLPGDIIGMRDFGFSRRLAGVAMINDGLISPFTHQQLFELFGRSPALAVGIIALTVRQQAMLTERLVYLGRYAAHERLAHFLYELYLRLKRIGAVEENGFHMPLSQEQVGDALGLSAVHVSRTFSMLRDEGLVIRDRQHVVLPDPDALARLVEFNDTYIDEALPVAFQSFAGMRSTSAPQA
ncbi:MULTISPECIES: Crp/Fnr family transcriptional regulator [Halomonadaceae]|nr:Crp/Fnr family transcriptional regulator [Halomonas sulfidivorans]